MKDLKTVVTAAVVAGLMSVSVAGAATLITGANVKNSSLTGADIKNGSLTASDLSAATRSSLRGHAGANGAAGVNGAAGAKGDAGAKGENGAGGATGATGQDGAAGANGAMGDAGQDAAYTVKSLVPSAADESTAQSNEWRSYKPNPSDAPTPSIDADGIKFGEFADDAQWTSAYTYVLKGVRLEEIASLAYSTKYTGGSPSAAPYVVIVTEHGNHVMFAPAANSALGGVAPRADAWQRWAITKGGVTYDDDGSNATETWDDVVADHGDDKVDYVQIQAGAAPGVTGSTSHVRNVTIEAVGANAEYGGYTFGS
jgi:hypothetical protein